MYKLILSLLKVREKVAMHMGMQYGIEVLHWVAWGYGGKDFFSAPFIQ